MLKLLLLNCLPVIGLQFSLLQIEGSICNFKQLSFCHNGYNDSSTSNITWLIWRIILNYYNFKSQILSQVHKNKSHMSSLTVWFLALNEPTHFMHEFAIGLFTNAHGFTISWHWITCNDYLLYANNILKFFYV